jgi:DNA-binding response OmpR family regulator
MILLVEDDKVLNENIREALIAEGYQVDQAFDGFIAEKMLKKGTYQCVILDINLPLKNGYEVCKSFRQFNTTTPVLLLTAFDELEDKVQGFESGADDYLTKPFFTKELLMRVQALIKRSSANNTPLNDVIVAGDLVINQRLKTVTRAGQEVKLTPREYQILYRLVTANGEPVSKQLLIQEIWGSVFDANTNNIEVFINFLRNKIDKPFGKQSIKTKVGYGYYYES